MILSCCLCDAIFVGIIIFLNPFGIATSSRSTMDAASVFNFFFHEVIRPFRDASFFLLHLRNFSVKKEPVTLCNRFFRFQEIFLHASCLRIPCSGLEAFRRYSRLRHRMLPQLGSSPPKAITFRNTFGSVARVEKIFSPLQCSIRLGEKVTASIGLLCLTSVR